MFPNAYSSNARQVTLTYCFERRLSVLSRCSFTVSRLVAEGWRWRSQGELSTWTVQLSTHPVRAQRSDTCVASNSFRQRCNRGCNSFHRFHANACNGTPTGRSDEYAPATPQPKTAKRGPESTWQY